MLFNVKIMSVQHGGKMKITKLAIPALLLLLLAAAGCRKDETLDIRGTWEFRTGPEVHYVFTFSGSRDAGTLAIADPDAGAGTYAFSGKEIVFDFTSTGFPGGSCRFSGTFASEDRLVGTMDLVTLCPPITRSAGVEGRRR
jgi:hypothetical protein